jgi:FMN phosphatase YigB (HAD superfamily)
MVSRYSALIISFLYLTTLSLHAAIVYPDNYTTIDVAEKPVIIFDVDQVLLDRLDIEQILILPYLEILLDSYDPKNLLHYIPTILNMENPHEYDAFTIARAFYDFCVKTNEEIAMYDMDPVFDNLVLQHPILQQLTKSNISLAERLKWYGSRGTARQETVDILLKLHNQNYPIALATNQGYSTLNQLLDAQTLPDATHYELIYTCDYSVEGIIDLSSNFIKKPSLKYFVLLKKALAEKNLGMRTFVFIDDRLENVQAAVEEGIIGIHFENTQRLKDDLATLGIEF